MALVAPYFVKMALRGCNSPQTALVKGRVMAKQKAHSIEYRFPYLDYSIGERVVRVSDGVLGTVVRMIMPSLQGNDRVVVIWDGELEERIMDSDQVKEYVYGKYM